jgi:uncharacterized protein YPO0396
LRDCTTCPDKDYCIPDECEKLGAKKMPSRTTMRKGHLEKYPFKVYHIVKPKGNRMIELKITVDKAVELEQEVKDLYQSIVGAPVKEESKVVEPAKKETPKKTEPVKESSPKEEAPTKAEAPKVEEQEAPKQTVPSLEATRAAVKDYIDKAADKTQAKTDFKALLDEIGAEKVTSATDEQRIQIMEWVNSRG